MWSLHIKNYEGVILDVFLFKGWQVPESLISPIELTYKNSKEITEALNEWDGLAAKGFFTRNYDILIMQHDVVYE